MSHEIHQSIINQARERIYAHDLTALQDLYENILLLRQDEDYAYIDPQYLYQKILLIAVPHNNWPITEYLLNLYHQFDDVAKIPIRDTFKYAKYRCHSSNRSRFDKKLLEMGV